MMDSKTLTDYELRHLETIRCNNKLLASLFPLTLKTQTLISKRTKSTQPATEFEHESEFFVYRCGLHPPSDLPPPHRRRRRPSSVENPSPRRASLSIQESRSDFLGAIRVSDEAPNSDLRLTGSDLEPRSQLVLRSENVRKVGNESILSMRFLPLRDQKVTVVGNRVGELGFWDMDFFS